ncbi:LuxR C-terminal-related transcriptional regulator [Streptomyces sp. NPDC091972]|uniref:LuxR C-terminal-related transcriptional regulator n=1 Tax=Streptomyces sp. NPDC091972 TaxID=3366007 RepID=UPI00381002FC
MGDGSRQVARRLLLAEKAVRTHASRIRTELDVHDRAAAPRARDAATAATRTPTCPGPPDDPAPPASSVRRSPRALKQGQAAGDDAHHARDGTRGFA